MPTCTPRARALPALPCKGFIDGLGPMSTAPRLLLQLGVQLLRSVPLRQAANKVSDSVTQ